MAGSVRLRQLSVNTRYYLLAVLAVGIAVARIASTYHVFTQAMDEPNHIAAGMQLLQDHVYDLEFAHAPVGRVLVAIGPYLEGLRMPETGELPDRGNAILNGNQHYWRNLALARMGTLPFFMLACAVVWCWADHIGGKQAALLGLAVFSLIPPVLAHASLATLDLAAAATVVFALYRFALWLENPSRSTSLWLGVAVALSVLTKFSAVLFLPGCAAVLLGLVLAVNRGKLPWQQTLPKLLAYLCLSAAACWLVVWAGYFFTVYPVLGIPFPGGQAVHGILQLARHNGGGHSAFFLGEWRRTGWWYFFPVLLGVKTPLPFFLLLCGALIVTIPSCRRQMDWRILAPGVCALSILLFCIPSHINIGLRHVLPIYLLLAIMVGFGLSQLPRNTFARGAAAAALVWLLISSLLAHPNYLAYFNELASQQPERIEVDSDLDWGQDLARLAAWLKVRAVNEVSISYFGSADLSHAGLPAFHELRPFQKVTGWVAISAYNRALPSPFAAKRFQTAPTYFSIPSGFQSKSGGPGPFQWLQSYTPLARIGNSIFVYNLPAETASK